MHSLYALANVPGYGATVRHDVFCLALERFATKPDREIREYLLRDILNLTLRNTDNHGRNMAVLRKHDAIALAPVFDFAPMFLDPEGINRVCRWEDERPGEQPDWGAVCEKRSDVLDPIEGFMP
jgi:serine/threonine-protein kinase HipA